MCSNHKPAHQASNHEVANSHEATSSHEPARSREPVIALIAAIAENGVIGHQQTLPWRIPSELRHFKTSTMNKPLIMGRASWDSLPAPLPGRDNLVLTRDPDKAPALSAAGAIPVHSPNQALELARTLCKSRQPKSSLASEIMVIGGAQIYGLFWPLADRIYLSRLDLSVPGDTRFPAFLTLATQPDWQLVASSHHRPGPDDMAGFNRQIWQRRT